MDQAVGEERHAQEDTDAYDRAVAPGAGPPEFDRPSHEGDLTPYVRTLAAGRTLSFGDAQAAFASLMLGASHQAEMGALLALLATRVPTVDELAGAAAVMRAHVDRLDTGVPAERLLDTAGTGGTAKLFNVSTAAAIVAAAAGAKVAKHGNRSRTGRGSAEVLAELGVDVDAGREAQRRCIDEAGICFCFAIHHHPATRHVMPVRRALGIPTIFNLLGPLTNPAGARRQVIGVYAPQFVRPVAEALARLGAVHAVVMHGTDGIDECSVTAPTMVAEVRDGSVGELQLDARDLGLRTAEHRELGVPDLAGAARLVGDLLSGRERGPARDMLLLNAGMAIAVAGVAADVRAGVAAAERAIDGGDAALTLERLRAASRR